MARPFLPVLTLAMVLVAGCGEEVRSSACSESPGGPSVELVYRVAAGDAGSTASRLCSRLRALGSDRFQVGLAGSGRIRVAARDTEHAHEALEAAIEGTSLRFYDWEPSVRGRRGPAAPFAGGTALFEAVELASASKGRPARFYLFSPDKRPLARPAENCESLLAAYSGDSGSTSYPQDSSCLGRLRALGAGGPPAGSRVLTTPARVAVIEDQRIPGQPPQLHRYFVIEDDAELSNADIKKPRQKTDEVTGEPAVTFDFTAEGRRAFKRLTERVASRAAKAALANGASEASFQHFAIVVNQRIVSLAAVDAVASPNGIDAPSARIAGIGSREEARILARRLDADPLGAELELVSVR